MIPVAKQTTGSLRIFGGQKNKGKKLKNKGTRIAAANFDDNCSKIKKPFFKGFF